MTNWKSRLLFGEKWGNKNTKKLCKQLSNFGGCFFCLHLLEVEPPREKSYPQGGHFKKIYKN
ncbi:MAG: hypothetical protein COX29_00345 [Candidatus Moranbacteria bacterium CG23_combo_of_CG06-09_8_20_14_all_35_22]|nr:MAG: hypothetical protein COX29_00345 [Candidatus Moranbacteria bacterium CG23_combo_of_CG06-09_8_20_14_all_35_22]